MRIVIIIAIGLLLSACGGDEAQREAAAPAQSGGVIPQHQLDAMNKAENVEDMLKNADAQRREQVHGAN